MPCENNPTLKNMCKRPYIDLDWCAAVIGSVGRLSRTAAFEIVMPEETVSRFLRVVTLADGETIHNAFFDRRFRKDIS